MFPVRSSLSAVLGLAAISAPALSATTFGIAPYTGFASGDATRNSDNAPLMGFNNGGPFGTVLADGGGGTTSGGIGDGLNVVADLTVSIAVNRIDTAGDGGFLVDIFALATFDTVNYSGSISSSINLSTSVVFDGAVPFQAFIARTGSIAGADAGSVTLRDSAFNPLGPGPVMLTPGETYTLQINTFITAGNPTSGGNDSIIGAFVLTIPAPPAAAILALSPLASFRRRRTDLRPKAPAQ
ncbi:MAG: hypothetical protein KF768_01515 [Phycisphaeraceae bacterium]|nr:hypothetical protein [Phycisphaeraceae bacterium]